MKLIKTIHTLIIIFFITAGAVSGSASSLSDDEIVSRIAQILIDDYDGTEGFSFSERIVLSLSKNAYFETIKDWEKNYRLMPNIPITLSPVFEDIVATGDRHLDPEKAARLRSLFEELSLLTYQNIHIYYESMILHLRETGESSITMETIVRSISKPEIYDRKMALFERETFIKDQIREIFKDKTASIHFSFHAFAFNRIDSVRQGIIEKEKAYMEEMLDYYAKNRD